MNPLIVLALLLAAGFVGLIARVNAASRRHARRLQQQQRAAIPFERVPVPVHANWRDEHNRPY